MSTPLKTRSDAILAGQAVEQVDRYKYLGLVMHQNGTFTYAVESLKSAAQQALFTLQARCAEFGDRGHPAPLQAL